MFSNAFRNELHRDLPTVSYITLHLEANVLVLEGVRFNPSFNHWLGIIGLRTTETNRRFKFNRRLAYLIAD
jgi:hypothetical protein